MPLVSIVVPVYNAGRYLDQCVESLVNQSYSNLEIIIVDDASTDSSGLQCDRWRERDPRISVIHKSVNRGLSSARKTGMSNAHGEFLLQVDSDDWLDLTTIEGTISEARRLSSDLVFFSYKKVICDQNNHVVKEEFIHQKLATATNENGLNLAALRSLYSGDIHWMSWHMLIARTIYADPSIIVPEGINNAEDLMFTSQCVALCHRPCLLDKAFYNWRIRAGSLSHGNLDEDYLCRSWDQFSQVLSFLESFLSVNVPEVLSYYANSACNMAFIYAINMKRSGIRSESIRNRQRTIEDKLKQLYPDAVHDWKTSCKVWLIILKLYRLPYVASIFGRLV